jgi:adenosylmethionine-8-amino-7-oxononanoate aminotransferase
LIHSFGGERFGNRAHVGDIRGRGLLQAIEVVEDRLTKAPFDPALPDARHERRHARRPRAAGAPFIVTASQIDEIVDRLGSAVDDAPA